LQAAAQRRLKSARVNFSEGMDAAREARRDLDYTQKKISWVSPHFPVLPPHLQLPGLSAETWGGASPANPQGCRSLKSKAERKHPDAYAKASRKYDY
jgi:hypothetical protein